MKIHKIKLQNGQTIWIKERSNKLDDFSILLQDVQDNVLTEELVDGTIVDVWGEDLSEFYCFESFDRSKND